MDFREDSLQLSVLSNVTNYGSGDYSTSICNGDGELLFYSGGCYIINSQNEIMENADSINSGYAYIDFCNDGDLPMRLNNTIIPYPLHEQKYIYFNLDINLLEDILSAPLNFYYHVVDMSLDGGLGAVSEKNQLVVSDTLARGYVQATRHANLTDWWVTVAEWNSNCYYIIPVTGDGVGIPEKQCLGEIWHDLDGGGQAVFSPDGTMYARIGGQVALVLFDFEDEQGALTNPVELTYPYDEEFFRGIAFSPDSRYLYVSAKLDLFQFDLHAADIQGSIKLVGQLDPANALPGAGTLALQKLAPDGKIYIASPGAHKFLSVINRPNCHGTLCDFQPWSLELPRSNYAGLPNLPHFNIPGPNTECDSLVSATLPISYEEISIYPNPASNSIYIESLVGDEQYSILDMLGRTLSQGKLGGISAEIDISHLNNGIYFLRIKGIKGELISVSSLLVQK